MTGRWPRPALARPLLPRRPDPPLSRLGPRLSRRGLMTSAVLAGVLLVTGLPVQARARGGTLRLALAGPVPAGPGHGWDTRGPALAGLASGLVAETLTEIGPAGELLPGLAAAWESDGQGRDWRLCLAPGARFHDGRALAPADVVASLRSYRVPVGLVFPKSGRYAARMANLADAWEDGPEGVRLQLMWPDPNLPLHLAQPRLVVWREGRPDGVGTGLYRLDPESPADVLRALRVPHRRDGDAGFFEAVEVSAVPDPRARLRALLAGEADVADCLPPEMEAEAEAAGFRVVHGALAHSPRLAHGPVSGPVSGPASGPVSGLGPLDGGRIAERWWFAA